MKQKLISIGEEQEDTNDIIQILMEQIVEWKLEKGKKSRKA